MKINKLILPFAITLTSLVLIIWLFIFYFGDSLIRVLVSIIALAYLGLSIAFFTMLIKAINKTGSDTTELSSENEKLKSENEEKNKTIENLHNQVFKLQDRIMEISESYSTKIINNLKEANNRNLFIESVLDSIPVNVYSMNTKGLIVASNKELTETVNIDKKDLTGQHYEILSHVEKGHLDSIYNEDIYKNLYHEEEIIKINNKEFDILKSLSVVLGEEHEFLGVVVSFIDISNLKELQRELKAINKENQDILNNIKSGIISIGQDNIIKSQYSKYVEELFPDRKISNSSIINFLLKNNESKELQDHINSSIDIILHRKRTPVSTINSMPLLQEFPVNVEEERSNEELEQNIYSHKFYKLNFERIYDNNNVTGAMVIIDDVTNQKILREKLQKEKESHQKEIDLIYNLLKVNPQICKDTIRESYKNLSQLKSLLKSKDRSKTPKLEESFLNTLTRHSHSIKGLTKMLSMSDTSQSAHELETLFTIQRDKNEYPVEVFIDKVNTHLTELEEGLNKESSLANKILGVEMNGEEAVDDKIVKVEAEKIESLISNYNDLTLYLAKSQTIPKKALINLMSSIYKLRKGSIIPFVELLNEMVKSISKSLGKKVNEIKLTGNTTEVDYKVVKTLRDPIIHIIRNILDHGIEYPEQRKQKGKSEKGNITIIINEDKTFFTIIVKDDGAGLDMEKLRKKAEKLGMNYKEEKQLINLLFIDGFSTKEKVTEISGRGVGMSVVKEAIRSLGGKLYIKSVPNKGTAITMKIPLTVISKE